jgi:hypothetical protein
VAKSSACLKSCKGTYRAITIRPQRGNLAAKYDANAATRQETLRGQFGHFYDAKKVRNRETSPPLLAATLALDRLFSPFFQSMA